MSFGTMSFFSKALGRPKSYTILLPDYEGATGGPYPVLYLLHGLSDDHRAWSSWTSLDRYVRRLPLVVVMPDGERGFYTNMVEGPRYEDYLMQDLIPHVEGCYNVLKGARHTAIGGLSMGGYGAMKLGLSTRTALARWGHTPAPSPRPARLGECRPPRAPAPVWPGGLAHTHRERPVRPGRADPAREAAGTLLRLRHRGLSPGRQPCLPRAPRAPWDRPRVPGVPRRAQLGVLGRAHPPVAGAPLPGPRHHRRASVAPGHDRPRRRPSHPAGVVGSGCPAVVE